MAETDRDDLITILEEEYPGDTIPTILPMMPLRDVVIFNDMLLPLFVGREKSVKAVEEAVSKDRFLLVVTQKESGVENPKPEEIFEVGTVSRILRMLKLPDGRLKALVQGVSKARIIKYVRKKTSYRVKIELIDDPAIPEMTIKTEALMRNVRENSEKILALRGELTGDVVPILESIEDPGKLADLVASNLRLKIDESQLLLEIVDPVARLTKVNDILSREVELSSMQAKIQSDVKDEISKSQRDYFLREQMRAIHKELGEQDEKLQEVEEYRKKIKKAKMPPEAQKESEKQLRRLEQMHPDSAESSMVRTYLDWLVEMPWGKEYSRFY
jgi:ATP-dependent Lon protease